MSASAKEVELTRKDDAPEGNLSSRAVSKRAEARKSNRFVSEGGNMRGNYQANPDYKACCPLSCGLNARDWGKLTRRRCGSPRCETTRPPRFPVAPQRRAGPLGRWISLLVPVAPR